MPSSRRVTTSRINLYLTWDKGIRRYAYFLYANGNMIGIRDIPAEYDL